MAKLRGSIVPYEKRRLCGAVFRTPVKTEEGEVKHKPYLATYRPNPTSDRHLEQARRARRNFWRSSPLGLAYKSSGMLCVPEGLGCVLGYPLWNERTVLYATKRCKFTHGRDRAMCYLDLCRANPKGINLQKFRLRRGTAFVFLSLPPSPRLRSR